MASYGVTASDVSAMANGMIFTSSTRPTATQVAAWITQANARVSGAIRGAGADPDTVVLDTAGEAYLLAVQYVTNYVASVALTALDRRESDLAKALRDEAGRILSDIRTFVVALGDQRSSAEEAPGLAWAPVQYATDTEPTRDAAYWNSARGQL